MERTVHGLDRRTWMIFAASTLASNLFWVLSLASAIQLFRAAAQAPIFG